MTEPIATQDNPEQPPVPTPGDVAAKAAEELKAEEKPTRTSEEYEAEIAKLRKEAAGWRTKLREAEPVLKAHQEAEEANKSELQRAQEALNQEREQRTQMEQGYTRLELAVQYNIPPDDIDLIGSGSREEMEARAARIGAMVASVSKTPPPPSDRPVEGLRPGATPEPPKSVDNSYPANWGFQPQRQS